MSSWPQAVWIVKKLQKNFDFGEQITYYTQNLNTLNDRIINLNSNLTGLESNLENVQEDLSLRVSAFVAGKVNDNPDISQDTTYSKGTIWFVAK